MTWITAYQNEVKQATDEQLELWLCYMELFKDDITEMTIDKQKRNTYKGIIHIEIKKRKGDKYAQSKKV